MSFRTLSLTTLALVALSPSISFAGAEDHALKACVDAFAASLSSGSPAIKLNYARHASSPIADYYAQEFTFTLHANDRRSNTALGSVSCSATDRGTVIEMHTVKSRAPVTLAAR